jgi:phytoene/squalene synthetase
MTPRRAVRVFADARLAEHDATRMEQLCSKTALSTYSTASSSIVSELATKISALHS